MSGSSLRLLLAAALACALIAQEPGGSRDVSGVVYDARTNLPVEGATVRSSGASATTDSRGAFSVRPDYLDTVVSVMVTKPGYVPQILPRLGPGAKDLRIVLKPSPEITGRIVDIETGEPVAGVSVLVRASGTFTVMSLFRPQNAPRSDKDGRFAVPYDPAIGSLFVILGPVAGSPAVLLDELSEEVRNAVDRNYAPLFWPGDGSSGALNVASGATIDAGVLRLRKTDYYRANVFFPNASCQSGAGYVAQLYPVAAGTYPRPVNLGTSPCGRDFSVRGLPPGSYRLELTPQEADATARRWALMDFVIADKNVDLVATFTAGVDLPVRVLAAEGASLPERVTVGLTEVDTRIFLDRAELSPAANANVRIPNVVLGWKEVTVLGVPGSVVELRYKSSPLRGNTFRWDGTGTLEVVLDDRPGSITGRVEKSGGVAMVFAVPWPTPVNLRAGEGSGLSRYLTRSDPSGQFAQRPLLAGEYRVFAVPEVQLEPAILLNAEMQQRMLQQAERVILGRGETKTMTLPLLDPAR